MNSIKYHLNSLIFTCLLLASNLSIHAMQRETTSSPVSISKERTVDLMYMEAGGGHRTSAQALKAVMERQNRLWKIRLVSLNAVLGSLDPLKRISGISTEDFYNHLLKTGWTYRLSIMLPVLHWGISWYHQSAVQLLEAFWKDNPPDMVVSLISHFNRELCEAYRKVLPTGYFVTILTDFADVPPHMWIESQEQHIICGTDKAVEQAFALGHTKERVFRVSGMILRPDFYDLPPIDKPELRKAYGLDPHKPTALIFFGGMGSTVMTNIAQDLASSGLNLQLILLCGKNEKLEATLKDLKLNIPTLVVGFTNEVPKFMQMADFMIGKPGPACISEALAMKLPVIVDCNAWTMPQEKYNTEWLLTHRLGLVVDHWSKITDAVKQLLLPGQLEEYRARVSVIRNNAVFEITDILAQILKVPA